jgi:hypothetical protein
VWINGNLKLTVNHDWLDDFGGYAALYSHMNSNAEFDDITVLEQTYQTTNHKLIISSGTGGSTSPSPGTYRYTEGTPVTVTANPQGGYVFDQWLLDGQPAGGNPTKIVTMDQFHTLQANFQTAIYYNLYLSSSDGGYTIPSGTQQYLSGTTAYVTAYHESGYAFSHWELDSVNVGSFNPIAVDMYDHHSLHAVFEEGDPPSHSINIRGWEDVYCTEIYPDIYLNGDYYGTCEIYDTLEEGYYTFAADQYYDQFACYYVIVTDGGQWMEWGNSVQIDLCTDTVIDFYYTAY